jgi:uncharacterized protein DUF3237
VGGGVCQHDLRCYGTTPLCAASETGLAEDRCLATTIPKFHDWNNRAVGDRAIMSTSLNDNLPEVLKTLRTQPLFVMRLDVRKLQIVGATPGAYRRIGVVPGGSFEGERLSGEVLDGGNDWQTVRTDGATTLNARLVLETKDEALISMNYRGIRYGPPDVVARIEKGEVVDPTSYYFRINPLFETAAANYDWINRVVAVGIGHRRADGPIYSIFEVL